MLDPAVILPMVLGALVALAAAAVAFQLWLERTVTWNPWTRFGVQARPAARHRLGDLADPYRPRPAPVFRLHPGAQVDTVVLTARIEETRSRAGNTMWSWSEDVWAADTRELAAIR